jgi:hypothetical protein
MRRAISPAAYALELLANPMPLVLALLWSMHCVPPSSTSTAIPHGLAALLMLVKYTADVVVLARLRGTMELGHLFLLPLHELLLLWIWCAGLVSQKVEWRGTTFLLGPGSRLRAHGDVTVPLVAIPTPREELIA